VKKGYENQRQFYRLIIEKEKKMRAKVDKDLCTGCGLCAETCPDVFEMEDDIANVKVTPVPKSAEDCCREARDNCPVEAISVE